MSDRCRFCGSKNLDYNEDDVRWCEACGETLTKDDIY